MQFQRAQNAVFKTLSSVDRLVAYSLATPGCPSVARVRQTQVRSLLQRFSVSNVDSEVDQQRKKVFRNFVRGRFEEAKGDQEED